MKKFITHIINLLKTSKVFLIIVACLTALVVTAFVGAAVLISEEKQPTDAPSLSTIEISSDTATETVAETTESTTKAVETTTKKVSSSATKASETTTKYVPKETTTKKAETTTKAVVTTVSSSTTEGLLTLAPEQLEKLKTCSDCGKPTGYGDNGTCAKFTYDMNCPKCGEFCNAHTCHTCK